MKEQLLTSVSEYMRTGIHIGTKFRTKFMHNFIYKIRNDKLSILNIGKIDERLKIASCFMSGYEPTDVIMVCKRENGWKAVKSFSYYTGIKSITKYKSGTLTNMSLECFIEARLLIAVDGFLDFNAIRDASRIGIPIIALCDSNNKPNFIDLVVPCNNKGGRSLGLIFYLLAQEYLKLRGIQKEINRDDFIAESP